MGNNEKNTRLVYMDYMRVAATLAVILIHVSAQNWYSTDIHSFAWQSFNVYDSISRWAVPVFVMISGAVLLDREMSLKFIYKKKVLRLFIAYIVWSLVYTIYSGGGRRELILNFIEGSYHMWFIPMIIGLYISLPIIKKIIENETVGLYFLVLSFVFVFLLPQIVRLSKDFGSAPFRLIADSVNVVLDDMHYQLPFGYTCYFVLGNYLKKKEFGNKEKICILIFGILGFLATVVLSVLISLKKGTADSTYYSNFSINVLLESIGVFVFLKYHAPDTRKLNAVVLKLSQYSFGTYLVHVLVLKELEVHGIQTMMMNQMISVPLIGIIIFVISSAISAVIHHIPYAKKYIV